VGGGLPVLIESGKGAVVRDIDGKEYIDCTS
jgi:glutamate-1-semialdehyde aminotransferase